MNRAASGPDLQGTAQPLYVPAWMHFLSGAVVRHPRLWIALGNAESRLLARELEDTAVRAPIYVTGLARSGSTMLLELLARHPDVVTHRYRDYPPLFIPYWWNRWLDRVPRPVETPRERAHNDRIAVTSESPEAFEEMLWMAFFPDLHDPHKGQVLDGRVANGPFDAFYRDHIRKLLHLRGGRRYCAKANYNVSRLGYLRRLFPDARFVVPVRDPMWHIASLMKQHRLMASAQAADRRVRLHLRRVGHYEFGLDRSPANTGEDGDTAPILACWEGGREVEGWARYWACVYGHVLDMLAGDADLRHAVMVVRYEDLCRSPRRTMQRVLRHVRLEPAPVLLEEAQQRLSPPQYYAPRFTSAERDIIAGFTGATARRLGYGEE